jgi:hypothetical protein
MIMMGPHDEPVARFLKPVRSVEVRQAEREAPRAALQELVGLIKVMEDAASSSRRSKVS